MDASQGAISFDRTCQWCASEVVKLPSGEHYCDWCDENVPTVRYRPPVRGSRLDDAGRQWLKDHEKEINTRE